MILAILSSNDGSSFFAVGSVSCFLLDRLQESIFLSIVRVFLAQGLNALTRLRLLWSLNSFYSMSEPLNQLKFKIAALESALADKERALQDYRTIEEQADSKIKALNKVHNEKVKSLLNSLQIVKKEKAAMESLSKEHKRSKLIEQLNKEILDQDLVIEVLRKSIYDEKGKEKGREFCDGVIIKALTKGPQRIRPLTREELRMEIQRLKLHTTSEQGKGKTKVRSSQQNEGDSVSDISSITEKDVHNEGEQVFARLRSAQAEKEALKLELASKGKIIEKLRGQGREKDRLRAEVQLLSNELEVSHRRSQTFQRLLREAKEGINGKLAELYARQLRVEQLELDSKQNGQRLKQAHQSANILLEEIKQQKEQLKIEIQLLKKQNEQILLQNITLKKRSEEQKNKINEVRLINNKNKEELTQKLKLLQQTLQKNFLENKQLQEISRTLQSTLYKQRGEWVEEKAKLIKQIEDLQQSNQQAKLDAKTMEQLTQLRRQNKDLKEVIDGGMTNGGDNKILLQRLQNYELQLQALKKGQSKSLYDEVFGKYNQLLIDYQALKKDLPQKKHVRKNLVEVTTRQRDDLNNLSSGISGLNLEDVDSDLLDNFDSDYEYSVRVNDLKGSRYKALPKLTEEDRELLKLLSSDLWDFVRDDRIQKKIGEMDQQQSLEMSFEKENEQALRKRIRQIKNVSQPRGKKIAFYDSQLKNLSEISDSVSITSALARQIDNYDSQVDVEILKNPKGTTGMKMNNKNSLLHNSEGSSKQISDLSSVKSGESSLAPKKKTEKASGIKLGKSGASLSSQNKSGTNSDVSSFGVGDSVLDEMDSRVSADFRRIKGRK